MHDFTPTHKFASRFLVYVVAAFTLIPLGITSADEAISFSSDVQPILSENCFQCHGPDPGAREADLRLDSRDGATEDRGDSPALLPGDPEGSRLIQRVTNDDDSVRMPPLATGKRLSDRQITILTRWIAEGGHYESHWAFQPIQQPSLPDVENRTWPQTEIDYFVLAQLEHRGYVPSPPAPREVLARRLYLDLLGLQPRIAEVDAFANDTRPNAYERFVERVLSSPRFGERWGRHWLDQARYADSHGYTNDNERIMWPYRDWVIAALNRDLSFDQFTIDQLAGDLLPNASLEQLVATGFHRNTLINSEGGTKADQFRDEQVKDRVDTTGSVWMSLTVGCAKCHTHKYDPVTQEEYYQLYAFFNSTADNNSIVPTIKAPTFQQALRMQELDDRRRQLEQTLADDSGRLVRMQDWEASLLTSAAKPNTVSTDDSDTWTVLELDAKSAGGARIVQLEDGSLLVSGPNVTRDEYQLTARSPLIRIRSIRLEVLTHDSLPHGGPGRASNGNFLLSEIWFRTGDGRELRFKAAVADHSQPKFEVAGAIDGKPNTGWAVNDAPEGGPNYDRTAWFVLPSDVEVEAGHALVFTMQFNHEESAYNLGRLRISASDERWREMETPDALARLSKIPAAKRTEKQQQRLENAFLSSDSQLGAVYKELLQIIVEREELEAAVPTTMIMRRLEQTRPTHLQTRGDFLRRETEVIPDVPAVLPPLVADSKPRTRLELARWLVQSDNPLTSRVRVNRLWMRMFGSSLVQTENDFGTQGTLPTHPRLLDWLAAEFMRRDWSTKRMLWLIAMSATYQQSSAWRGEAAASDPANQWLARQNRVRVEGEIVRDLALGASRLLSDKIGGPSVFPPQPDGVYAFTQRKMNWRVSEGNDRYRRGMYTFFYRSAPYPMLTTFDAPKFNQTCTRRNTSNTPLQALTVANDEALHEMAKGLARRAMEHDADLDSRLGYLFRLCISRPASEIEIGVLRRFWQTQVEHFSEWPAEAELAKPVGVEEGIATEAAAWVATARVVLNLDEFITRE
jgi:hypothetical protein